MSIRLFSSIFLIALAVASCQDPKEEVISLDEIMPKSERYDGSDSTRNKGEGNDSIQTALNDFASGGLKFDALSFITDRIFPERFGPKSVDKFQLTRGDETIQYYRLLFSDSVKTKNAFFNWIDCFGENCNPHFVGESTNFQKNAFTILVNDTSLFFIESTAKIDMEEWFSLLEKKEYTPTWNYVIEQLPRGKAKWFQFVEEKKVKLTSTRKEYENSK